MSQRLKYLFVREQTVGNDLARSRPHCIETFAIGQKCRELTIVEESNLRPGHYIRVRDIGLADRIEKCRPRSTPCLGISRSATSSFCSSKFLVKLMVFSRQHRSGGNLTSRFLRRIYLESARFSVRACN